MNMTRSEFKKMIFVATDTNQRSNKMTRTMCDLLLLNSVATNYPTTYKGESVIEILEILFTNHEAQLKAKDEEIERLNELIRRYESDE